MKKILIVSSLGIVSLINAQIAIGINPTTPTKDIILDINSSTNKGLLIPRVIFNDENLKSTTHPIINPAEGLIVYNSDTNKPPKHINGFYIRNNNEWQLISTDDNKSSDIFLTNGYSSASTSLNITNNYRNFNHNFNSIFTNTIIGSSINQSTITLPKGNYDVTLTLNLNANMGTTTGVAGKALHTISYKVRYADTSGNLLSEEFIGNYIANANAQGKHTMVAKNKINLSNTTPVVVQIMRVDSNSTFTGTINYSAGSLHFFRGISK